MQYHQTLINCWKITDSSITKHLANFWLTDFWLLIEICVSLPINFKPLLHHAVQTEMWGWCWIINFSPLGITNLAAQPGPISIEPTIRPLQIAKFSTTHFCLLPAQNSIVLYFSLFLGSSLCIKNWSFMVVSSCISGVYSLHKLTLVLFLQHKRWRYRLLGYLQWLGNLKSYLSHSGISTSIYEKALGTISLGALPFRTSPLRI